MDEEKLYNIYEEEFINWLVNNEYIIKNPNSTRTRRKWKRFIRERENLSTGHFECNIHTCDWYSDKSDDYIEKEIKACELCKKEDESIELKRIELQNLIDIKYGIFEWSKESYKNYNDLMKYNNITTIMHNTNRFYMYPT